MRLQIVEGTYAVCRLSADAEWEPPPSSRFSSVTRTSAELSIVCEQTIAPPDARIQPGWRCFRVEGQLDFALTGVLKSIASPLAANGVSIFTISTFDTDYVLVQEQQWEAAITALGSAGFEFA